MTVRKICNLAIQLGILALIIFPPIFFGAVQPQHVTYIELTILVIGLFWLVKILRNGKFSYISSPLDIPILAFILLGGINWWTSVAPHLSEKSAYLLLNYAALYFLVVQQLKTRRRILGLAFILLLIGSGESFFGIFQYLKGTNTVLGVMTPNTGTLNATYMSHNHFAGFLVLVLPVALGLLVGTSHIEKKFFLFLLAGLMGTALVLTLSRGGLLGIFFSVGCFLGCLWWKKPQKRIFWIVLCLVLVLGIFMTLYIAWIGLSPTAHRSLFATFVPSEKIFREEIRFPLWRSALGLVKEFPLLGSGLGTFQSVFPRYRPAQVPQNRQPVHLHNDYLELLTEAGIFGLLLALWAIFRFFRYVLHTYFQRNEPVLGSLALGCLSSCAAFLIHSVFDFNLHIPANALLFCVIAALATASVQLMQRGYRRSRGQSSKTTKSHRSLSSYSISAWKVLPLALCALAFLSWNFRTEFAMSYHRQALLRGQPFYAMTFYQKAMRLDGTNPFYHQQLAQLYHRLGRTAPHGEKWFRLAVQEYQQAIARHPYHSAYYFYQGWNYDALDMIPEAVQAFKQAIHYTPRIAFYHQSLGEYYLSLNEIELAMQKYKQALEYDPKKLEEILQRCREENLSYAQYAALIPDNAASRTQFARILAEEGGWEQSKAEYRKALDLSDNGLQAYQNMLKACRAHHDFACLRELWQELRQRSPENFEYAFNIAESFIEQKNGEQAIEAYQALLQDYPQLADRISRRLAVLYQQQGRSVEALEMYTLLLRKEPQDVTLYHHIADLYRREKDWQAAIAIYRQALESGVQAPTILSALGDLLLQTDEQREALRMYEQAMQQGETRFTVYRTLERLYQAQNNEIALDLLWDTYILVNKHQPQAIFELVKHYESQSEWLKAVSLSKELVTHAPTNVAYREFLAQRYEEKGMLREAVVHWEKLAQLHVNNVHYKLHLAQLYEQVKQTENAKLQYRKILRLQPGHQHAQKRLTALGG